MTADAFIADPFYASAPLIWVLRRVRDITGLRIEVDQELTDQVVSVDHDQRLIRVRPGLSPLALQGVLGRVVMLCLGGFEWAPEFRHRANLSLTPFTANSKHPHINQPYCDNDHCAYCFYSKSGS